MATIMGNLIKNGTDINDEIIADNMLASAQGAATLYLNATMTSTTPELKAILSNSLSEVVSGHAALTQLTINKGWNNPYVPPTVQLTDTVNKSRELVQPKR